MRDSNRPDEKEALEGLCHHGNNPDTCIDCIREEAQRENAAEKEGKSSYKPPRPEKFTGREIDVCEHGLEKGKCDLCKEKEEKEGARKKAVSDTLEDLRKRGLLEPKAEDKSEEVEDPMKVIREAEMSEEEKVREKHGMKTQKEFQEELEKEKKKAA